ncbi:MAG: prepilin-type N-terminal cleavage/methylation domain-containing protein [Campylobacteraceae bacterium]|jgi:prepilin-type N-terminal cleavage/methylation domain-containing protein|nr:prepilin-type N-terminal cleavage/methylation domain-containing protein [Campylobacteraceae bacterium]
MKKAFSLIELVVTIVIVGIVSMSFPLILRQTSANVAFAMQQEAILEAKTYMGTILSYPWDQNSTIIDNGNYRGIVVHVDSGDTLLEARGGHISGDLRRKIGVDEATNGSIGICGNDLRCKDRSSMNSFSGVKQELSVVLEENRSIDTILKITLTPTIGYVSDRPNSGYTYNGNNISFEFGQAPGATPTNIKRISIAASNTELDDPEIRINLRAYSSNIGEFQLDKKEF